MFNIFLPWSWSSGLFRKAVFSDGAFNLSSFDVLQRRRRRWLRLQLRAKACRDVPRRLFAVPRQ